MQSAFDLSYTVYNMKSRWCVAFGCRTTTRISKAPRQHFHQLQALLRHRLWRRSARAKARQHTPCKCKSLQAMRNQPEKHWINIEPTLNQHWISMHSSYSTVGISPELRPGRMFDGPIVGVPFLTSHCAGTQKTRPTSDVCKSFTSTAPQIATNTETGKPLWFRSNSQKPREMYSIDQYCCSYWIKTMHCTLKEYTCNWLEHFCRTKLCTAATRFGRIFSRSKSKTR